ncbi:hypothetical protein NE237_014683 [Protea cynaroides]|uniref:Uncharacterized protein n=1 Tax=Protea cynaroides TaxID=273540 RepID=A0A9Q0KCJ6_9MAGN|nr:hypothetical protein NE237_014683 [Protea cynaroides]
MYDTEFRAFTPDHKILDVVRNYSVRQTSDFKQIQKLCMPFLRFKKDEVASVGVQALDLKLPLGEIEVLQETIDLIKRQLGLEEVEVLCASQPNDVSRAGAYVSLLNQNPPSPGNPTAIFLNR